LKWFKHYSDNYRGRSVLSFHREFGHSGVAWYYLLTEICTEKLEKSSDADITETACTFSFDKVFIESSLRGTFVKIKRWLDHGAVMGLWSYTETEHELCVKYPILLELLDSDQKKTRSRRDKDASKQRLDKDKDKDKEYNSSTSVEVAVPPPSGFLDPVSDPKKTEGQKETAQFFFDAWNANTKNLPKAKELTKKRITAAHLRFKEHPDKDAWIAVIRRLDESHFCNGQNKSGWRANFDFLLQIETFTKASEGAYDNKKAAAQPAKLAW
jgi:hypothetical protein